ncbi:hypothetical protein JQ628_13260 [Bradyrhizobium lablabi]|uniref:hypothetical protein n=1 Tax=Bradyrhizobium lablabi TaxID=722472 RepID=UPI001BAB56F8|nr:hypothetical protein [Bradyrhizobium lablabi]MBR1122489.1 hypothetical protein [Bradyrhizobium lablabi]
MGFFKRELSPVERFENGLKEKLVSRQRLAERLGAAEAVVAEKRAAAERLAVAGAPTAQLERAETNLRTVEERTRALRAELADLDEQVAASERALNEARAQRDRDAAADGIEAMASAIEKAVPQFQAGSAALLAAVANGRVVVTEATKFSDSVEAVRREVLAAAELLCWELRSAAMRTRVGNGNEAQRAAEPAQSPGSEIERQLIYTLNPLSWREGGELRSVPAFTLVGLPKALLAVALRHQHVDYMNARRVQTLMHVHGNGQGNGEVSEAEVIDLDVLAATEQENPHADVA